MHDGGTPRRNGGSGSKDPHEEFLEENERWNRKLDDAMRELDELAENGTASPTPTEEIARA